MRLALALLPALLQAPAPPASPAPPVQTQADDYTRYELLGPGTGRFRILYEVTATTPGAAVFFNPIRKGSAASREAVFDRASGRPLPFTVVSGKEARAEGLPDADGDAQYLKVLLPRPVPAGGETRLLIDKTYQDLQSYVVENQDVVFSRTLGVRRNAVVLPEGYELVGCNVPAQVRTEPDGRVAVSFMNPLPVEVPVVVRGRRLP